MCQSLREEKCLQMVARPLIPLPIWMKKWLISSLLLDISLRVSLPIHSEDESARSPRDNPTERNSLESQSQQFSDDHCGKNTEADAETNQSFGQSAWGTVDNDDADCGVDSDKHNEVVGSSDFGVRPTRTESPSAESFYDEKCPFTFQDSVPTTPLTEFGSSPSSDQL
ncbi:hypothetical protein PVK06_015370 [Gossypium arboreum]|uniref:Uncharacterized protein n=1 Tax=Gossypium arboreum TaxID=29729 RepID=A0ABR0PXQ2_GOSAR|nr:hypothetical protein PVK06_015370 [Gossypium arboreum]